MPARRRRSISRCGKVACSWFALLAACAGQVGSGDPIAGTPDATPSKPAIDATQALDAALALPDAAPPTYPAGPYGMYEGDVIEPLEWDGFVDSANDADDDPFNEPPTTVSTEAYFQGIDRGARLILINASAGTCSFCQAEMPILQNLYEEYESRGARIITALLTDDHDAPADTDFARQWGQAFDLTFASVADPTDELAPFFEQDTVPMNMFVDASTMTILAVIHGFDESYARQMFDYYGD